MNKNKIFREIESQDIKVSTVFDNMCIKIIRDEEENVDYIVAVNKNGGVSIIPRVKGENK